MSAFIVGKPHIDALVRVGIEGPTGRAVSPDTAWHTLRWFTVSDEDLRALPWQEVENVTHRLDYASADGVGAMLWGENVRSIQYRYPDTIEAPDNMPGPCDFSPADVLIYSYQRSQSPRLTAVEALSAIDCYEYQSCEHPEWVTSEARRFCDALRRALIHALPGYREGSMGGVGLMPESTPSEATMARVNAALDKMRAIAHAEGMEMVRNADNTGRIFVGRAEDSGN